MRAWLGLVVVVSLSACPSPPKPVEPAVAARLELPVTGLVLDGDGASRTLAVKAFDASGSEVIAELAWSSSAPDVVSVDASGKLTAVKVPGSAVITVKSGDATASASVATVRTQPGAVLVSDAQLDAALTPVDRTARFGLGWRYRVTLVGVAPPAVGGLLIASETAPVAGKVVEVSGQTVTLEVVPLSQLFSAFEFKQTFSKLPPALSARAQEHLDVVHNADGSTTYRQKQALSSEFEVGPFDCEAESTLAIGFAQASFDVVDDPTYEVEINNTTQRLILTDAPTVTVTLEPALMGELNGTLECKLQLYQRELPVPGPVGIFLGAVVQSGIGFALAAKTPIVPGVSVELKATATGTVKVGFDCTNHVCTSVHEVTVEKATGSAEPKVDVKLPATLPVLELSADVFAYVDVKAGVTILRRFSFPTPREIEADIFGGKLGLHADATLATEARQAQQPGIQSGYALQLHGEVGAGDEIGMIVSLLELGIGPLELKFDFPIATSPSGGFQLNQGQYAAGDTVEATVTFDAGVTFPLYGYNLEKVKLMRQTRNPDGGEPGLVLMAQQTAAAGQRELTLTGVTTEAGAKADYVVFATSKLWPQLSLEQPLLGGVVPEVMVMGGSFRSYIQEHINTGFDCAEDADIGTINQIVVGADQGLPYTLSAGSTSLSVRKPSPVSVQIDLSTNLPGEVRGVCPDMTNWHVTSYISVGLRLYVEPKGPGSFIATTGATVGELVSRADYDVTGASFNGGFASADQPYFFDGGHTLVIFPSLGPTQQPDGGLMLSDAGVNLIVFLP